jgi:hypothetical protein
LIFGGRFGARFSFYGSHHKTVYLLHVCSCIAESGFFGHDKFNWFAERPHEHRR